ncbi:MAG: hypothetical protein HRU24_04515 [Gammaproteobacteria bacterium]|nr:hypothetical protein [Gammaproteobacteria bacterium]
MIKQLPALLGLIAVVAFNAAAVTSIDKVMSERGISGCLAHISAVTTAVVKHNKHRFHGPETNSTKQQFSAFGVIGYRDRNSHLNVTTATDAQGECQTTITETFVVPHPCITAREEVYKKWTFVGMLTQDTMVLTNPKHTGKLAYLSAAVDGSICLITTKFSVKAL